MTIQSGEEYIAQRLSIIFTEILNITGIKPEQTSYTECTECTYFDLYEGGQKVRLREDRPDALEAAGALLLRMPYSIHDQKLMM